MPPGFASLTMHIRHFNVELEFPHIPSSLMVGTVTLEDYIYNALCPLLHDLQFARSLELLTCKVICLDLA